MDLEARCNVNNEDKINKIIAIDRMKLEVHIR